MDRVAIFVDAGYLFAQGTKEICGEKLERSKVLLDYSKLRGMLEQFARHVSDLPLLRIYWYDGASHGPSAQHIALAYQEGFKVRLGLVNQRGEQKGVDSLIVTDMLNLARNRAMSECVLLSGDEDVRVGVQQAQEYGILVHLLGIKPSRGSQSVLLIQEADTTNEWDVDVLSYFMNCRFDPATQEDTDPPATTLSASQRLKAIAQTVASQIDLPEVRLLATEIRVTNRRPFEIDRRLLALSRASIGRDLEASEKSEVRTYFFDALVEIEAPLIEAEKLAESAIGGGAMDEEVGSNESSS